MNYFIEGIVPLRVERQLIVLSLSRLENRTKNNGAE
jgi:hypothetical protein